MASIEQGRPFDWLLVAAVRPVVFALFRLRVEGEVPALGGPLIVAANHVSFLDPVVLGVIVGRSGRIPRFLVTAGAYDHPISGPVFRRTSVIRVGRGAGGRALALAEEALHAGGTVVIYPEGHVGGSDRQLRAKLGVVALSRRTGAPVLPVAQWGMQRGERRLAWARRRSAAIVIGEPLPPPAAANRAAAEAMLDAIRALLPRAKALASGVSPILGMSRGGEAP